MKHVGTRMSKMSMPKINASGESAGIGAGGGGHLDWIQVAETLTSMEHHLGTGVLNRKTRGVKFNSHRIVTRKSFNRN
jgi:hypothetical protein